MSLGDSLAEPRQSKMEVPDIDELIRALMRKDRDGIVSYIENGGELNFITDGFDPMFTISPLHYVIVREDPFHTEMLQLFLAPLTTDPNIVSEMDCTPLHWAVRSGRLTHINMLLQHPRINVNPIDWTGKSPLADAVASCEPHQRGCRRLVELDISIKNEIVRVLTEHGGKVIERSKR